MLKDGHTAERFKAKGATQLMQGSNMTLQTAIADCLFSAHRNQNAKAAAARAGVAAVAAVLSRALTKRKKSRHIRSPVSSNSSHDAPSRCGTPTPVAPAPAAAGGGDGRAPAAPPCPRDSSCHTVRGERQPMAR